MNAKIKNFIEDNINLIEEDTKESWEKIYTKIPFEITGKFTEVILSANINPLEKHSSRFDSIYFTFQKRFKLWRYYNI